MARGGAMDAVARFVSRQAKFAFPLLALICSAQTASAASMSPSPMFNSDTSASAEEATSSPSFLSNARGITEDSSDNTTAAASPSIGGGGSSSLILLAIVCGSVVAAGVGVVLLCCLWRNRAKRRGGYEDKARRSGSSSGSSSSRGGGGGAGRRWGIRGRGQEGTAVAAASGEGRRHPDQRGLGGTAPPISNPSSACHSRSASLALMAAPFEGSSAWHAAADEEEGLEFDLGLPGAVGSGGGGAGGRESSDSSGACYANPLYAVNVNKSSMDRGAAVAGGGVGVRVGGGAPAPAPAATASPSAAGDDFEEEHDRDDEEKGMGRRGFYLVDDHEDDDDGDAGSNTTTGRIGALPQKIPAAATPDDNSGGGRTSDGDIVIGAAAASAAAAAAGVAGANEGWRSSAPGLHLNIYDDENSNRSAGAAAPRRWSVPPDEENEAAGPPRARRRLGGRTTPSSSSSSAHFAATSVLKVAEEAVSGAQSLFPLETYVPGAREASGVVAGLARLAAASHRADAKDMRRRVRWCRSLVVTLERARGVLEKATEHDATTKRLALEAVKEAVAGMVEIVQSYKNKHFVSEVILSSLLRRRQKEADAAILAAERYLAALEENAGDQVKTAKVIMAKDERKRRQRRSVLLDQVDIPASSLNVIEDEVLGLGGFGTVYMADLGCGLNAAAKVVQFRPPVREDSAGDSSSGSGSHDDDDDSNDEDDNDGYQPSRPSRPQTLQPDTELSTPTNNATAAGDQEGNGDGGEDGYGAPTPVRTVPPSLTEPPVDQKARRRAVVAKARRAAADARTEGRQRLAFCQELEAMKRLRSPHTVHIYGAVTTPGRDRLVLVMEFLPGGDLLLKLSKAKRPLDDRILRQIARDICSGMAFLHQEAFVHGDLKSANVLFDAKGRAKIADLGTSLWTQCTNRVATYSTRPRGLMSLPWAAPEVLCREMATSMSDVYSFGVVLWECLTRKVPWADVADVGVLSMAVVSGERPPVPENAPEDLAELARRCWSGDPTARPTLESVLSNYL